MMLQPASECESTFKLLLLSLQKTLEKFKILEGARQQ
jgi:hypothetical protein